MANTFINSAVGAALTGFPDTATTGAVDMSGANEFYVFLGAIAGGTISSIFDTVGSNYELIDRKTDGSAGELFLYKGRGTGAAGWQLTVNVTGGFPGIVVLGFHTDINPIQDQYAENSSASTTGIGTGSITTLYPTELGLTAAEYEFNTTVTVNSEFSTPVQQNFNDTINFGVAAAYKFLNEPVTIHPFWSVADATALACAQVSFRLDTNIYILMGEGLT